MALLRPRSAETVPAVDRTLTAASATVTLDQTSSWKTWKFGNADWQDEVWRLYDIIPELHKLAGRIGDSLAKARLYVTEVDQTGEETGEVEDDRIRRLAAVPLGTGSQRDDCLRLAGVDLAVAGECWIVGEGAARGGGDEGSWFVVTGAAFRRVGDEVSVTRPRVLGGSKLVLRDGVDVLIRCWRPHPNNVDLADSFTRSAIPPLREIELLTKREFAELDSRLTGAGLMFVPEGMDFPRQDEDPGGLTGLMAYIQRAAAASMADQSRASAMVPIMVSVPDHMVEHMSSIRPVTFWSELSGEITPMKDRAITRLASSAEIPAEVLTGMGDSNHWSAWLISDEGVRWISGYLGLIADALTRGFLHRALAVMGVSDPEHYAFAFDTSTLAAKPNRMDDALQLHDRFLITDEEAVRAGAFDVEQMPTNTERAAQIALKLVQQRPELLTDPAIQAMLGFPALTAVGSSPAPEPEPEPVDDVEDEPVDGPPNGGAVPRPEDVESARAITSAFDRRIALAASRTTEPPSPEAVFNASAKLIVYRALELAGGRLATPAERRGRWRDVPRHELHHHVGPITLDKAQRVTEGAWNHVAVTAADLGVDADDLHRLLSGYVMELLTRGIRHHDDLLFAALQVANRGAGVMAS